MMSVEKLANAIANNARVYGMDPITILAIVTTLLPLFAKCFGMEASEQAPADYLRDHYDDNTASFDKHLIDRARPQTRRAARQSGQRNLTREQLDSITVETFYRTMYDNQGLVAAALSECNQGE